jgi:hypothetical protein
MARDPAPAPTPAAAPQPFLLQGVGQRRDSFFTNYESLWAKLWGLESTLVQVEAESPQQDTAKKAVLRQCKENLREARDCLERHKAALLMRPTSPHLFWRLAHQIDEDLLLIMPRSMLAVVAPAVEEVFRRNISDKLLREQWLGKDEESGQLSQAVKRLTDQGTGQTEARDRSVLKDALSAVNERTDRHFYQVATNTIFQVLSSVILLLLLIALGILGSLRFASFTGKDPENLSVAGQLLPLLMLVGATGAILSNTMSKEPFVAPAGQAGRFFMYHLLGKPVLGATAALFLFFLVGSGWLLDIHSSQPGSSPSPNRPLQITVGSDTAVYFTHFLLAFVAGFAAERLLRGFIDKAIKMLLQQAEKSEVSKPPGTPERAPA